MGMSRVVRASGRRWRGARDVGRAGHGGERMATVSWAGVAVGMRESGQAGKGRGNGGETWGVEGVVEGAEVWSARARTGGSEAMRGYLLRWVGGGPVQLL